LKKQYQKYDLILIFSSFQRCISYLIICSKLSKNYKIGIYKLKPTENELIRLSISNQFFFNKLKQYKNIDILNKDLKYEAKMIIHPQKKYDRNDYDFLSKNVKSNYKVGLSGLAMGNSYFQYLPYELDCLYVPDLRLYNYRINKYSNDNIDFKNKVIEVGSPLLKYNLNQFEEIDYLIVGPSMFSFLNSKDILLFLKRLNYLIKKIKSKNNKLIIAYKPHNADERYDALINPNIYKLLNLFPFLKSNQWERIFSKIYNILKNFGIDSKFFISILICFQYFKIEKCTINLSKFSEYNLVNVEVFLNFIKKGVITGRSNTIWHCLFHKVPVFNLIDETKPYIENKMHQHTMNYLGVHFNDSYIFQKSFKVVSSNTREKDLIMIIKKKLDSLI
tara:strand:- start:311 stop:1480 length:1170 start_codon:yes stop_codon:yes gene_type:complete